MIPWQGPKEGDKLLRALAQGPKRTEKLEVKLIKGRSKCTNVPGLTNVEVHSPEEVYALLERASSTRTTVCAPPVSPPASRCSGEGASSPYWALTVSASPIYGFIDHK